MRSLPLALLVAGALLAPSAAFAAGDPTSPPSRYFIITGIVFGDRRVEASGKLGIDGGRLFASVGCNTIGGTVSLDGDTLTIPEPLAMTEMACPGTGDTEAMLIKILQAGPFTIGNGAWTGKGAAILVEELPAGPGPGASLAPPDGVVSSSLQPGGVAPTVTCPPIPDDANGTSPAGGAPNAGSVGASAGGIGGSAWSGGTTEIGSGPAATALDVPLATAVAEPAGSSDTPRSEPAGTAAVEPGSTIAPPPPPEPAVTPDLGSSHPQPSVAEPGGATGPGIGTDPGVGKPVASDPCAERMAAIDGGFAGGTTVEPPKAADATAEHSTGLANAAALAPIGIGLGLVVIVGLVGFVALRRAQASRPPTATGGGPAAG